jgi:hypothetical protein
MECLLTPLPSSACSPTSHASRIRMSSAAAAARTAAASYASRLRRATPAPPTPTVGFTDVFNPRTWQLVAVSETTEREIDYSKPSIMPVSVDIKQPAPQPCIAVDWDFQWTALQRTLPRALEQFIPVPALCLVVLSYVEKEYELCSPLCTQPDDCDGCRLAASLNECTCIASLRCASVSLIVTCALACDGAGTFVAS